MTRHPLVSIGVPIYNEERFLSEALASLVAQDYENVEIVIFDNGSTDSSPEICRAFVAGDERVRYFRHDVNKGAAYSFDRVFQLSSGSYFTWASGHDMRAPSAIRKCVEFLEQRPDVVLCYPRTSLVAYDGARLQDMDVDRLETAGLPPAKRMRHVILRINAGNAIYGVVRSAALRQVTRPQAIFWSDLVFLGELSLQGGFHQLEERLFLRRENRAPESRQEKVSRSFVTMNPQNPKAPPSHPEILKTWELMKVGSRAPFGFSFRLSLFGRAALWGPASSVYARVPGLRRRYRSLADSISGTTAK
jgi:glycosyltransferase involved in cell wall biosynthesis